MCETASGGVFDASVQLAELISPSLAHSKRSTLLCFMLMKMESVYGNRRFTAGWLIKCADVLYVGNVSAHV